MFNMNENTNKSLSNDVRKYLWPYSNYAPVTSTLTPTLFSCYDDYYCNSDQLALTGNILLGIFALTLTIIGIILNVLLIPIFSLVGIRSSATYYMIGMAISDCCLLIINVMLVVIRYVPSNNQLDQLHVYQNFVAYLVPFGVPLKTLCQTLTTSLCACLMIDRFVYFRTEHKANTAKRTVAVKVLISVVTVTTILKLPNFLVFKIVENPQSFITVRWTLLAKSWIFIIDLTIFSAFYVILFVFTFVLWHILVTCKVRTKNHRDKLNDASHTKLFRYRERGYIKIGLVVGVCTVILKFPQLLHNVFFGFSTNRDRLQREKLAVADLWMETLDILLIVTKSCLYLLLVAHFRRALTDMIGLWVSPSRYKILKASGGLGKLVDLTRCDYDVSTTNSLLHGYNSEKGDSRSLSAVDTLAVQCVMETGKVGVNNGSNSLAGSYDSVSPGDNNGEGEKF